MSWPIILTTLISVVGLNCTGMAAEPYLQYALSNSISPTQNTNQPYTNAPLPSIYSSAPPMDYQVDYPVDYQVGCQPYTIIPSNLYSQPPQKRIEDMSNQELAYHLLLVREENARLAAKIDEHIRKSEDGMARLISILEKHNVKFEVGPEATKNWLSNNEQLLKIQNSYTPRYPIFDTQTWTAEKLLQISSAFSLTYIVYFTAKGVIALLPTALTPTPVLPIAIAIATCGLTYASARTM